MKRIVDYTKIFINEYLKDGDIAVDFTMGNGNDTLYLALKTPHGKVFAFDIQKEAIEHTQAKLDAHQIDNVELILDGHEKVKKYISNFKVGIFNFGYLPHGQVYQPTLLKTSCEAVKQALGLLEKKGLLILVIYPGHAEGKAESEYFTKFTKTLDTYYYESFIFQMMNKMGAPYIIGIEKKHI